MSKHTARHNKKAAIGARAARPVKRAHGRKSPRVKKAATKKNQVPSRTAAQLQVVKPDSVMFQFVNLDDLGQGQVNGQGVVEIFAVEVADDAEGTGPDDRPLPAPDSSD